MMSTEPTRHPSTNPPQPPVDPPGAYPFPATTCDVAHAEQCKAAFAAEQKARRDAETWPGRKRSKRRGR